MLWKVFDTPEFIPKQRLDSMRSAISAQHSQYVSTTESAYLKIVFDLKSGHSSDDASASLERSGRMREFVCAATRAVKVAKACWKCKFLRKIVGASEGVYRQKLRCLLRSDAANPNPRAESVLRDFGLPTIVL